MAPQATTNVGLFVRLEAKTIEPLDILAAKLPAIALRGKEAGTHRGWRDIPRAGDTGGRGPGCLASA